MTFAQPAPDTPIASVDRALAVLERLTQVGPEGENLGTLAQDLDISKAGLHHTLAALRHRGWVEQNQDGTYVLGPVTGQLAQWWTSSEWVVRALHPALMSIGEHSQELVHFGRLTGRSVVYLDKVEPDRPIRVWSQVGRTVPAVSTAMGRAILGTMFTAGNQGTGNDPLRSLENVDLTPWMNEAPAADAGFKDRVLNEFGRVYTHGYAREVGENEKGIACVAVPINVIGRTTMAISITAPEERLDANRASDLAALIANTVNDAHLSGISATSVS